MAIHRTRLNFGFSPGLGIYKAIKELVHENTLSTKKASKEKKKKLSFFFDRFLGRELVFLSEFFFSWTRSFFLERMCVFLNECVFSWTSACFLGFLISFFSFINSGPRVTEHVTEHDTRYKLFLGQGSISLMVVLKVFQTWRSSKQAVPPPLQTLFYHLFLCKKKDGIRIITFPKILLNNFSWPFFLRLHPVDVSNTDDRLLGV